MLVVHAEPPGNTLVILFVKITHAVNDGVEVNVATKTNDRRVKG